MVGMGVLKYFKNVSVWTDLKIITSIIVQYF